MSKFICCWSRASDTACLPCEHGCWIYAYVVMKSQSQPCRTCQLHQSDAVAGRPRCSDRCRSAWHRDEAVMSAPVIFKLRQLPLLFLKLCSNCGFFVLDLQQQRHAADCRKLLWLGSEKHGGAVQVGSAAVTDSCKAGQQHIANGVYRCPVLPIKQAPKSQQKQV